MPKLSKTAIVEALKEKGVDFDENLGYSELLALLHSSDQKSDVGVEAAQEATIEAKHVVHEAPEVKVEAEVEGEVEAEEVLLEKTGKFALFGKGDAFVVRNDYRVLIACPKTRQEGLALLRGFNK